uniref:Yippee domain-containing protein n=1 Tax=Mesocestoides corti TaxID=53468 RepID=A0A5K3FQ45_MESCO
MTFTSRGTQVLQIACNGTRHVSIGGVKCIFCGGIVGRYGWPLVSMKLAKHRKKSAEDILDVEESYVALSRCSRQPRTSISNNVGTLGAYACGMRSFIQDRGAPSWKSMVLFSH